MNAFRSYLDQQLAEMLRKRSIVVFYDPRREFEAFFDSELEEVGTGYDGLPRVFIGEELTFLARHCGSLLGLRAAVEPIAAQDAPERLVLYLPGVERDRRMSVLMELEKAGTTYEPQLRRLARNVLQQRFTDGQIDQWLANETLSYADIVALLDQGDDSGGGSVLRIAMDAAGKNSEELLAAWIADAGRDAAINEKQAMGELLQLLRARLGLQLDGDLDLETVRRRTRRHVLVAEFRDDLTGPAPATVDSIAEPATKDQLARCRRVAELLREDHAGQYPALADQVETDLRLAQADLAAESLGSIDTFRFEEGLLLSHAAELAAGDEPGRALELAAERSRSFWVDRDVQRQAQWEACRRVAELAVAIQEVGEAVGKQGGKPEAWVSAYTAPGGWHLVDALHRQAEAWMARLDDEPECERAWACVRRAHEDLLREMAKGFSKAFQDAAWTVPGALHQTKVYSEVVEAQPGRTAYFLVDAMRFEMAAQLAEQLADVEDLVLRPAVAALPSITPVGMAALMPGASSDFSVEAKGKELVSRVDGSRLASRKDRVKHLKARVPGAVDVTLGDLIRTPSSRLAKKIGASRLVLVLSQEIDLVGESDGDLIARQFMETVLGNLARAVRKLARAGVEHFVLTSDHGHQFSLHKGEDMRTDSPGGDTVDLHRRCWAGHGGATPPGTVRVQAADLGYDSDLEFVFPTGIAVFRAGGDLSFHHGAFSLQELLIPVLSFRVAGQPETAPDGRRVLLEGVPLRVTNRAVGVRVVVEKSVYGDEPLALRVVLQAEGEEIGQAGMAFDADLDRSTGVLHVKPGDAAHVGLLLTREDIEMVRVVVMDATTEAILVTSDDLPVKLGM